MKPSYYDWGAGTYARHRPTYPATLVAAIASRCRRRRVAWDCAAGSGQASTALAEHFHRVVATDINLGQLRAATPEAPFDRVACNGLAASFAAGTFDLVTVAQALHWFPAPEFFAEVERVAGGGVLAAWNYGLFRVDSAIDAIVDDFYRRVVGSYWPAERRHIENDYADIDFPFPRKEVLRSEMTRDWTCAQAAAFVGTWSATRICRSVQNRDPVPEFAGRLAAAWGEGARRVTWAISAHVCPVP